MRWNHTRIPRTAAAALAFAWTAAALAAPAQSPQQPPPTPAAAGARGPVDITPVLAPLLEKFHLPAIGAVVIRGDEVIAQGVAGVRAAGHDEKATIDDQWHIGSCTKSMTATMLATLVERGELSWQSTIGDVLTDVQPMNQAWKAVTLDQLLAHRAGVPADLSADNLWDRLFNHTGTPLEQRRALVAALLAKPPVHAPGTDFLYANAGFTIAAAFAEKVTGKPWEELMQERLFQPLHMASAGFGAPGMPGAFDQPRGHDANGVAIEPGPNHGGDNPPAIGPGGTVHTSLPDWGRYVGLHLAGESGESTLLKPETVCALHAPFGTQAPSYGWGWTHTTRPWAGGPVFTHNGSNTLWFAVVWAAPKKNMAVLIACNAGGAQAEKACDEAAGELVTRFIAPAPLMPAHPDEPRPDR